MISSMYPIDILKLNTTIACCSYHQDEDFIISESCVQSAPAQLPPLLLRGIKILANALKEWHALKSVSKRYGSYYY